MKKLLLVFLILLSGCTEDNKSDARLSPPEKAYQLEEKCLETGFKGRDTDSAEEAKNSSEIAMDCLVETVAQEANKNIKTPQFLFMLKNLYELKDNLLKFFKMVYIQNKNCQPQCKNNIITQYSYTADVIRPILAQLIYYNDKKEGIINNVPSHYKPNYPVEESEEFLKFIAESETRCSAGLFCPKLVNHMLKEVFDSDETIKNAENLINDIQNNYTNVYEAIFFPRSVPDEYLASLQIFLSTRMIFANLQIQDKKVD